MKQRIVWLDFARGFTILFMPSIHIAMLYSNTSVQQSILGNFLKFIAEGPGAQIFMTAMGIAFTYSHHQTVRNSAVRGVALLAIGYTLNIFKFIIPFCFGFLPKEVLGELSLPTNSGAVISLVILGDILHFAALAMVFLALVYTRKQYWITALVIVLFVITLSPIFWDLYSNSALLDHALQLLGGHPPQVYFPFFPWIVYPLTGLAIGHFLHHKKEKEVLKKMGLIGVFLLVFGWVTRLPQIHNAWLPFYRTETGDTIFHLGIVLCWLWMFYQLQKIKRNSFFLFLTQLSKRITAIYLIQWVVIFWCLPLAGYRSNNIIHSILWMLILTTASFYLAGFITNQLKKHKP